MPKMPATLEPTNRSQLSQSASFPGWPSGNDGPPGMIWFSWCPVTCGGEEKRPALNKSSRHSFLHFLPRSRSRRTPRSPVLQSLPDIFCSEIRRHPGKSQESLPRNRRPPFVESSKFECRLPPFYSVGRTIRVRTINSYKRNSHRPVECADGSGWSIASTMNALRSCYLDATRWADTRRSPE